jgi:molybdopterin-guanine dinucleotide biosynthesis protein A
MITRDIKITNKMPDSIAGYILAGGASRRMGTDKARLTLAGESFVERIARELRAVSGPVTLVGGQPIPELSALRHTPDVIPNWGTLGGVHAALGACSASWALVVGCDFPFVTTELFLHLLSLRTDHHAVAPIQADGIPQPLCSLYRVKPCLQVTEQLIKSGERKPVALLQSVSTRWVSFAELSALKGATHFFDNINTPEDYSRVSNAVLSEDVTVNE